MKTIIHRGLLIAALPVLLNTSAQAEQAGHDHHTGHRHQSGQVSLQLSDGSAPVLGLAEVNRHLAGIGVRVGLVEIPSGAKPILRVSKTRALNESEAIALIGHFRLDREDLLDEISAAGRPPAVPDGGHLQTSERGVPPYPKVYDMKAMDEDLTVYLQDKFGRLHVNRANTGEGIDEVMTIVSGGPYTWFFVLEGNVVAKVRFGAIREGDRAWRISYPGLVPHGGYFDAKDGLVVAYAHGPRNFVMRYEDRTVAGHETLGDNPWIEFSDERPILLDQPRSVKNSHRNLARRPVVED